MLDVIVVVLTLAAKAPEMGAAVMEAAPLQTLQTVPLVAHDGGPPPLPPPPPPPPPPAPEPTSSVGGVLARIRGCESGTGPTHPGRYHIVNDHGLSSASGAYQFIDSTWWAYRGDSTAPRAYLATPAEQDAAAARLYAAEGTRPWNPSRGCWS